MDEPETEPEILCDLCGGVAHHEDDHVTYCDCGVQACSACIVRVENPHGEDYVCKDCADELGDKDGRASA